MPERRTPRGQSQRTAAEQKSRRIKSDVEADAVADLLTSLRLPVAVGPDHARRLADEVTHYKFSRAEFLAARTRNLLLRDLERIRKVAGQLSSADKNDQKSKLESDLEQAVSRHPELRARLVGVGLLDGRTGKAKGLQARQSTVAKLLQRPFKRPDLIADWAQVSIQLGATRRDRSYADLATNTPATWLFVSVLLRFWQIDLGLPITNWTSEEAANDRAGGVTKFVKGCFVLAGEPGASLSATRQRITRVRKIMDANEARGAGWTVLAPGPGVRRRRVKCP